MNTAKSSASEGVKFASILGGGFIVGLIPDLIFVWIIWKILNSGEHITLWSLAWAYLFLTALRFILWVFRSAFGWAWFYAIGMKFLVDTYVKYLQKYNFPIPYQHNEDLESYFPSVAANADNSIDLQKDSIAVITRIDTLRLNLGMFAYIKEKICWDRALRTYRLLNESRRFNQNNFEDN